MSRRRSRQPRRSATKCEKPAPAEEFLFRDILCAPAMGAKRNLTEFFWAKVVLSDIQPTL